ncbi:ATP-binding cassette domain-containing protein [Hathewaya limosa]|nr:ATP-binding cassette domain-containing protein [Hathewaya limosa]
MQNLAKNKKERYITMNVIETTNLSKEYFYNNTTVKALNKLSLNIKEGEIVGLVGPNGAGKSTAIKLICGILNPSNGEVRVLSKDPFKNRKKLCYELGVMFGQRSSLWYNLPVIESLYLMKDIYNISTEDFNYRLEKYAHSLDVTSLINKPVRKLSFGQRIKCELLAVILHNPKLIILDEPTIGLDVLSKQSLRNILYDISKENNSTILITSHDLHDIEKLCSRIVFINKGELQLNLNKDELCTILKNTVVIYIERNSTNEILTKSSFYRDKSESNFKFVMPYNELPNFLNESFEKVGENINFKKEVPSLEDILYEYYK